MADQYIMALDQGTTSTRAILFDADGKAVATAQKELPQILSNQAGLNTMRRLFGTMRVK